MTFSRKSSALFPYAREYSVNALPTIRLSKANTKVNRGQSSSSRSARRDFGMAFGSARSKSSMNTVTRRSPSALVIA